jgi:hypothetical protein
MVFREILCGFALGILAIPLTAPADCRWHFSEGGVMGKVSLPYDILAAKILPQIPNDKVLVTGLRFGSSEPGRLTAIVSTSTPWVADIAFDFEVANAGQDQPAAMAPALKIAGTRVLSCQCDGLITRGLIVNVGLMVVRAKLDGYLNQQIRDFLASLVKRDELKGQPVRFWIEFCPMELVAVGYTGSLKVGSGMVRENLSDYSASGRLKVEADTCQYEASDPPSAGQVVIYFFNRRATQAGFNVSSEDGPIFNSAGRLDPGQSKQVTLPLGDWAGKTLKVTGWRREGQDNGAGPAADGEVRFKVAGHGDQSVTIIAGD